MARAPQPPRGRSWLPGAGTLVVGLVASAAAAAVALPADGAAAPPPRVFVAPNGSDGNSCKSRKAACASFGRAYRVARPGQVVEVAGGRYPGQTIRAVPGRKGPHVTFRPARGKGVILGGLTFGGGGDPSAGPDFVTVKRMKTSVKRSEPGAGNRAGVFVGPGSRHIKLVRMTAGSISTWLADRVLVRRGKFGPCHAVAGVSNVCGNSKIDVSTNVTIDGAVFHDYRFDETCFQGGAACHWECMYVNGGRNVTIKGSKFRDCAIYDIFATISGPEAARIGHRRLRIVNNWFDTPWTESRSGGARARATAVSLAWCQNSSQGYRGVYVGFNSFQRNTGLELDGNRSCLFEDVEVVGNLMGLTSPCDTRVRYAYNLLSQALRRGRCGGTERIGGNSLPYAKQTSGRGFDFHLRKGKRTRADNLVPRSIVGGCVARDIDRQRRPLQRRCDSGSDERRL